MFCFSLLRTISASILSRFELNVVLASLILVALREPTILRPSLDCARMALPAWTSCKEVRGQLQSRREAIKETERTRKDTKGHERTRKDTRGTREAEAEQITDLTYHVADRLLECVEQRLAAKLLLRSHQGRR